MATLVADEVRAAVEELTLNPNPNPNPNLNPTPAPNPKQVWHQMLEEFTTGLTHVVIEGLDDLLKVSVS